jgi:hypothetical protein
VRAHLGSGRVPADDDLTPVRLLVEIEHAPVEFAIDTDQRSGFAVQNGVTVLDLDDAVVVYAEKGTHHSLLILVPAAEMVEDAKHHDGVELTFGREGEQGRRIDDRPALALLWLRWADFHFLL